MAMKKAFEFRIDSCDSCDTVKVRLVAIAEPGELRDGFYRRAKQGAEVVARALRIHYGALAVKQIQ